MLGRSPGESSKSLVALSLGIPCIPAERVANGVCRQNGAAGEGAAGMRHASSGLSQSQSRKALQLGPDSESESESPHAGPEADPQGGLR